MQTQKRQFIKAPEIMAITGWSKSKTYQTLSDIRHAFKYPFQRKDVTITDFCEYTGLKEDWFRACIKDFE